MNRICIKEVGIVARVADWCFDPLMRLGSGTFFETPQRTHRWNNHRLTAYEVSCLNYALMVVCRGGVAPPRWKYGLPIMHLPLIGGWKRYIVVQPEADRIWHPGWVAHDVVGVSRYAVQGPARLLYEGGDVSFFAVMSRTGQQLKLKEVGRGQPGDDGPFKDLPLF